MDLETVFGLESVPKQYFQSLAEVLDSSLRATPRKTLIVRIRKLSSRTNIISEHLVAKKDVLCETDQDFTVGVAQERRMVKASQPRVIQIPKKKSTSVSQYCNSFTEMTSST